MAKKGSDNGLNAIQQTILNGVEKKDIKLGTDLDNIEQYIRDNNSIFKKYTGNNIIELLTSLAIESNEVKNMENLKRMAKSKRGTNRELMNKMFSGGNFQGLFDMEKKRIERYQDYKMIEVYIPELAYCLNVIRDSIVSPNSISKKFLNIHLDGENIQHTKSNNKIKNINCIVDKFDIESYMMNNIRKTIQLGDQFTAVLSYKSELEDILLRKQKDGLLLKEHEDNNDILLESAIPLDDYDLEVLSESLFNNYMRTNPKHTEITLEDVKRDVRQQVLKIVNENFAFSDNPTVEFLRNTMHDIEDFNKQKANNVTSKNLDSFKPLNIDGAFLKELEPEKTVVLRSDNIVYGYLYMEQTPNKADRNHDRYNVKDGVPYQDVMSQINGDLFAGNFEVNEKGREMDKDKIIANVFGKVLEKKLNRSFITKNKEFKEYIYSLAKSREISKNKFKIIYFSPEEVQHFHINMNEEGYGTSVLSKSLFFAMLYISTLISELMTKIARGRDTRSIMVDVGLDGDLEGAIQGVISDIKSKEITIDNLSSITSILSTLSTFDDYFIPVVDGEEPIKFDTIPGGGTGDVDTQFLQDLLKSAVAGTGVPGNMVDAAMDVEFAKTIISNNDQFARMIIRYQTELGKQWSNFMNKLYNTEYPKEKDKSENIEIIFPEPSFLMLSNLSEQISNSAQTIDYIVDNYVDPNSQDEKDLVKKFRFKKEVTKKIITDIDWSTYDDIFKTIEDEAVIEKYQKDIAGNAEQEEGMDDGMGMDGDMSMGGIEDY